MSNVDYMKEIQSLVDQLVETQQFLDEMGAFDLLKEHEALKKTLAKFAEEFDPDEAVTFVGKRGQVSFSKAQEKRTVVNLQKLNETLGDDAFYKVVKVSVSALKKWLPDREIGAYCEVSIGSRRLTGVKYE